MCACAGACEGGSVDLGDWRLGGETALLCRTTMHAPLPGAIPAPVAAPAAPTTYLLMRCWEGFPPDEVDDWTAAREICENDSDEGRRAFGDLLIPTLHLCTLQYETRRGVGRASERAKKDENDSIGSSRRACAGRGEVYARRVRRRRVDSVEVSGESRMDECGSK